MKTHRAVLLGTGLAAALGAAAPARAQVPLTPRGLGMGTATMATARGQEALFLNPAQLGLAGTPSWSVAFPQVVAGATVLGLGVNDLNELRNYDDVSPARAQEILDRIPEGTGVEYDVKLPLGAIQLGHLAFGFSYNSVGQHSLDRDIVDLFLNGYQAGQTYGAPHTSGTRATYLDFAAGYGRRFGMVSVGIAGHYYHGRDLVSSGIVDVDTLGLPTPDVRVTYAGVRSDGGSGFGVDVGAAMQPIPGLTLSAAVANIARKMSWDEDLQGRKLTLNGNEIQSSDFRLLRTHYRDSEQGYDQFAAGLEADQKAPVEKLRSELFTRAELPATLRLGAAYSLPTGTDLAASFQDNLTDSRLTGLWDRSLGFGVQQKLPVVTLRAGFSTDLDEGNLLTAGLSLGPINLGVGRLDNGAGAGGAGREGWVASFGISTRSASISH
jgi:hypothetical protein